MIFTVTYRTAQGTLKHDNFESDNRSGLLEKLKELGITPISIRSFQGNNARKEKPPQKCNRKRMLLLFCTSIGCLIGVLVFLSIGGNEAITEPEIASVPAKKPLQKHSPKLGTAVTNTSVSKPMTIKEIHSAETNGMSRGRLKKWLLKHDTSRVYTNGAHRVKTLEERTFRHGAEIHIAGLIRLEPGSSLLGDSSLIYGKAFMNSFKKSLEEPIIISEEDSDEVKDLKKAVIETKVELKQRMDAGEDICKIMCETRDDLKKIGLYRDELNRQLIELGKDGQYSEQDMNDFVSAANQMLSERGAKPLSMPRILKYKFKKQNKPKGGQL